MEIKNCCLALVDCPKNALRRRAKLLVLPSLLLLYLLISDLISPPAPTCPSSDRPWPTNNNINFSTALETRVGPGCIVVLALVDEAFVDMAVNFHRTSLEPFSIQNFLFVGAGQRACDLLGERKLPCAVYTEDKASSKASRYGSAEFKRKMQARTAMVADALHLGYTVANIDLDVIFFKNPMPLLNETRGDIATLWDKRVHNAGFVYARPTENSKRLYTEIELIMANNKEVTEQESMNMAIGKFQRRRQIDVKTLDPALFQCGYEYFEKGNRTFPAPCEECVALHNNWIASKEAKIYRFREHFMWKLDDDGYYSSLTRKYMSYENPIEFGEKTRTREIRALKTALSIGHILDRTLILPRFHCSDVCPLNSILMVSSFEQQFKDTYRESSFLSNPLTPKLSSSDQAVLILTPNSTELLKNEIVTNDLTLYKSLSNSINSSKIKAWLGGRQEQVLRFHSLYNLNIGLSDAQFEKKLQRGIKKSFYRQLW